MTPAEVAETFQRTAEEGDWNTFESVIADDFLMKVPTLIPLGKRACIAMHKSLWGGFPDIKYHLRILSVQENKAIGRVRITGTHTGTLIPLVQGKFVSFAPTGKSIALNEERVTYRTHNDQLVELIVEADGEGSWLGIFHQIGVDAPF